MKLNFTIQNQTCIREDMNDVVAESIKYLYAKFDFDTADWNNTTKTAIFRNGKLSKKAVLDENNECQVPHEVLTSGYLYVSIIGTNENGMRITTNEALVDLNGCGPLEASDSSEITPSEYEQLTGRMASKVDKNDLDGTSIYIDNNGVIHAAGGGESGPATWGNIHGAIADQEDLKTALDAKANASSTYTKTEVDSLIDAIPSADLTGYATESFVATAISNIQIPSVDGLASETYVDNAISTAIGGALNGSY